MAVAGTMVVVVRKRCRAREPFRGRLFQRPHLQPVQRHVGLAGADFVAC